MTLLFGSSAPSDAEREEFARALVEGLSAPQKTLPCRFFYDARGSELFEEITALEEYYPTRVEASILRARAPEIAASAAPGEVLVEFGSGSSTKTEILLEALPRLRAYVAIDVSESALEEARARLRERHPRLRVETIVDDFWAMPELPEDIASAPRVGFFPGSTIGNFEPATAGRLLARFAEALGPGARLILGVDLRKDPSVLVPAYDDARGVTAAFNLNLLRRANRELGADFDLAAFRHRAVWNDAESRIEMHIVSQRAQKVRALGRTFAFAAGETIHTENSYKWRISDFTATAARAGWRAAESWTDARGLFSVHDLRRVGDAPAP